jgi:hypothetical protein
LVENTTVHHLFDKKFKQSQTFFKKALVVNPFFTNFAQRKKETMTKISISMALEIFIV